MKPRAGSQGVRLARVFTWGTCGLPSDKPLHTLHVGSDSFPQSSLSRIRFTSLGKLNFKTERN